MKVIFQINAFTCVCDPGFEGVFCENDINECEQVSCLNGGTCFNLINSYKVKFIKYRNLFYASFFSVPVSQVILEAHVK